MSLTSVNYPVPFYRDAETDFNIPVQLMPAGSRNFENGRSIIFDEDQMSVELDQPPSNRLCEAHHALLRFTIVTPDLTEKIIIHLVVNLVEIDANMLRVNVKLDPKRIFSKTKAELNLYLDHHRQ